MGTFPADVLAILAIQWQLLGFALLLILAFFFAFVEFLAFFYNAYYAVTSIFGLRKRSEEKILTPKSTFALLVAAHNEEAVVGEIIKSMQALQYPKDLYDIFVIADNCTDDTAGIARTAGAQVLERTDLDKRGKSFALEWAFEQVFALPKRYDAVCVFDADNLVSPQFLLEMNSRLLKGEKVIQGYLDVKNPGDNWITWSYAISYWTAARNFQLARYQAGLGCALGGTGFCIAREVLEEYGWDVTSLTDDLEYQMRLLLNGIKVTWAHDAPVYDEKPLTMKASWRQRVRWMQGHWDVATRYAWRLLLKGFRRRDLAMLDGAVYCLAPSRTLLAGGTIFLLWVHFLFPETAFLVPNLGLIGLVGVWIFYLTWPMLFLFLERAPLVYLPRTFILPIFLWTWIPITWIGFFKRRAKHWHKTEHTRAISITDIERR